MFVAGCLTTVRIYFPWLPGYKPICQCGASEWESYGRLQSETKNNGISFNKTMFFTGHGPRAIDINQMKCLLLSKLVIRFSGDAH